jgi:tripartite-type tricarboxylate transporter receptor subunit TctC
VAATPILPIIQHAAAGTIVTLAVTSTARVPLLKDVPTFAEIGYPEMNGEIWFWIAGPKNLPASIVQRLNEEMRRFIAAPETKQQFERGALLAMDADAPALTQYVADELKRWTAFVAEKGLKK